MLALLKTFIYRSWSFLFRIQRILGLVESLVAAVKQLGSVLSPQTVGGLGELPAASLSPMFPNPAVRRSLSNPQ